MQLEAVYLEALLYIQKSSVHFLDVDFFFAIWFIHDFLKEQRPSQVVLGLLRTKKQAPPTYKDLSNFYAYFESFKRA